MRELVSIRFLFYYRERERIYFRFVCTFCNLVLKFMGKVVVGGVLDLFILFVNVDNVLGVRFW